MKPPHDALLMVGFGGPTRPDEVRPFLENVVRGRPVPPARLEEVAHHYERIGGRSPYNEETLRQADALRARLAREGLAIPVYVGMRNWAPYVSDVMREIAAAKARRVFCFVMAPHRSEASWDRYRDTVADALAALGADAPAVDYAQAWHDHPLFIGAVAARVREALETLGAAAARRRGGHLHRSQHSGRDGRAQRILRGNCRVMPAGRAGTGARAMVDRLSEPQRQSARAVARTRHRRRSCAGAPAARR